MTAGTPGWRTTLWLATTGGRSDRVRVSLTAVGAAAAVLALLAAATVAAAGPGDGPYTSHVLNEVGLHIGVVITLLLLCVPVLAFTGQCSRIGAPARDRRLAGFRLSGATPADVVRVTAVETGAAAGIGSLAGLGLYLLGRVLLADPVTATYIRYTVQPVDGGDSLLKERVTGLALRLPTDVLPAPWLIVLIVLAVPVLAGLFALAAMRRVRTTPFGVVRLALQRPVRVVPAVLFLAGTAGMAFFAALTRALGLGDADDVLPVVFLVLFVMTAAGLVLGTAAVSAGIGRLLAGRTGRPSLLLAGRRLVAAPFQASRAGAALLTVVLVAAAVQAFGAWVLLLDDGDTTGGTAEALAGVDLALLVAGVIAAAAVLVGTLEGVLSRRRSVAALAAVGVPRGVLARALLLETLLPVVPAALLATAAGALAVRGVFGTTVEWSDLDQNGAVLSVWHQVVPVPWTGLLVIVAATVLGTAALAALALPLLRRAADPAELAVT